MITINGIPLAQYLAQTEGDETEGEQVDTGARGVQVDATARILSGRPMGTRSPARSHTKQRRLGRALAREWEEDNAASHAH
jgi:hypothetical protein